MSLQFSRVIQAGSLARDPELKTFGESVVCNLCIATNRKFKSKGELCEEVAFIECEAWGHVAEFISKWFTQGSGIHIEGRLKQDNWEKDGEKRSKIKIVIDKADFTDSRKNSEQSQPATTAGMSQTAPSNAAGVGGSNGIDDQEPPFACMEWLG